MDAEPGRDVSGRPVRVPLQQPDDGQRGPVSLPLWAGLLVGVISALVGSAGGNAYSFLAGTAVGAVTAVVVGLLVGFGLQLRRRRVRQRNTGVGESA